MRVVILGTIVGTACGVALFIYGGINLKLLMEDGGYFSPDTIQIKSDAVARLEATGEDLRVYVFSPPLMPNTRCVQTAGTNKGGLYCHDLNKETK